MPAANPKSAITTDDEAETGGDGTAVAPHAGIPGASALGENKRRRAKRIETTGHNIRISAGCWLVLRSARQHKVWFLSGADGEREVADSLAARTRDSPAIFFHDRRVQRGHGNIDHLAVAALGIYVIDAKNHRAGKSGSRTRSSVRPSS